MNKKIKGILQHSSSSVLELPSNVGFGKNLPKEFSLEVVNYEASVMWLLKMCTFRYNTEHKYFQEEFLRRKSQDP